MGVLDEVGSGESQLHGALSDGLGILDLHQEVKFRAYTRTVLPIDGYVFWQPLEEQCFQGSLHYTQEISQGEDETYQAATVRFTTIEKIVEFVDSPPNTIYIAWHGGFRFAFSQQEGFYDAANLWHYFGRSIPPTMETQLLDVIGEIDPNQAITSNSLALWIALNTYINPLTQSNLLPTGFLFYPAGLVPPNLSPPYGVVSIGEDSRALQAIQRIDPSTGSASQLCADRVKLILYGIQNNAANDLLRAILFYSQFTDNFGLMSNPAITDGRKSMAELQAVAMQKFIFFELSYYQSRVNTIAQQLITSAVPKFIFPKP